jgi:hypothetical protein
MVLAPLAVAYVLHDQRPTPENEQEHNPFPDFVFLDEKLPKQNNGDRESEGDPDVVIVAVAHGGSLNVSAFGK